MKNIIFSLLLAVPALSNAATLYHDSAAAAITTSTGGAFTGGVARFGYFAPSTNFAGSVASLESAFVQLASYTLASGTWNDTSTFAASGSHGGIPYDSTPLDNSAATGDLAGENIYLWVLNAATSGAATQHGIFSAPGVFTWIDANEPGANGDSNFSLSIGTDSGLVAHIGTARTDSAVGGGTGHSLAAIAAVPEPSRAVLALAGFAGVMFRRRRAAK